jgi:hypothetical protein
MEVMFAAAAVVYPLTVGLDGNLEYFFEVVKLE